MTAEEIIDKYVYKLNTHCLHKDEVEFARWTHWGITRDLDYPNTDISRYCYINNGKRILCHNCEQNLKDYEDELDYEPFTICRNEYESLVNDIKEIKETLKLLLDRIK